MNCGEGSVGCGMKLNGIGSRKGGQKVLYWHWSPNNGWAMNIPIRGFNECLIVYVLAASGDRYPVGREVYHQGWVQSKNFKNGKTYYGYKLPLGFEYGGPIILFSVFFPGPGSEGIKRSSMPIIGNKI